MQGESVRSIVPSDSEVKVNGGEVRFSLRPHKVYLFDAQTEARIRFEEA